MHPVRKWRLLWVLGLLIALGIAVGLVLYALRQNINVFYTPSQVVARVAPQGHAFRVGGLVVKHSVKRKENLQVQFALTDTSNVITVKYTGILPDLFREGQGIVAEGRLNAQQEFIAERVLAKHDENYMPPEVKQALDKRTVT